MNQKKVTYEVMESESIDECLDRMRRDGYMPVKRIEKPIFQENQQEKQVIYEPAGRKIIFEGKKIE